MATKILFWICSVLLLLRGVAPASQWQEPAESEKKMVWYTTIGSADAKMLIDGFRQRYPKIAAEYSAPAAAADGADLHRGSGDDICGTCS